MMSQEVEIKQVLPLVPDENATAVSGMVYEPDELTVLDAAVPEYVAGLLISAARESFACEVAARRTAMDSAGKNAQEMIDRLQLEYNRARQSAITQEITEIVAGSGQ
jgi:F-type H+-transporting ATPase subunit gamma